MKLVKVVWQDAADMDEGPWVERATAEPAEPYIFHQVGYLYSITSEIVVLTACVGKEQMGIRSQIPAGMVKSIVELTEGAIVKIPRKGRSKPKVGM